MLRFASDVALDRIVGAEYTPVAGISVDRATLASVAAVHGDMAHEQIPLLLKDVKIGLIVIHVYVYLYLRLSTFILLLMYVTCRFYHEYEFVGIRVLC